MQFTFVSLLLCTTLVSALPASLTPRDHQLRDSKKVPVLVSNNAVITSRFNVVYKQNAPDWHMTPETKLALGDDINRGFIQILPDSNAGGALQTWGTIQVFKMPEIAKGKYCRFYFFLGIGDAAGGFSRLQLYSLLHPTEVWEFNTTYNNRPGRSEHLGTFAVYPPEWLTATNPVPPVVANITDNSNVPAVIEEWTGNEYQRIELECPVGKVAYDLSGVATRSDGILPTVAWSLNKGLVIEILGVPKEEVPSWNPHDGSGI